LYQHLEQRKKVKDEWNEIVRVRFHQTSLSCIKQFSCFLSIINTNPQNYSNLIPQQMSLRIIH